MCHTCFLNARAAATAAKIHDDDVAVAMALDAAECDIRKQLKGSANNREVAATHKQRLDDAFKAELLTCVREKEKTDRPGFIQATTQAVAARVEAIVYTTPLHVFILDTMLMIASVASIVTSVRCIRAAI